MPYNIFSLIILSILRYAYVYDILKSSIFRRKQSVFRRSFQSVVSRKVLILRNGVFYIYFLKLNYQWFSIVTLYFLTNPTRRCGSHPYESQVILWGSKVCFLYFLPIYKNIWSNLTYNIILFDYALYFIVQ